MQELVTAVVKPHVLDEVKDALQAIGVTGLTVTEVKGFGRQGGHTETYRGAEYDVDFIPKIKVEVIVTASDVDRVAETIAAAAQTGKIGDGKLWTTPIGRLQRIRTGEMGADAI